MNPKDLKKIVAMCTIFVSGVFFAWFIMTERSLIPDKDAQRPISPVGL